MEAVIEETAEERKERRAAELEAYRAERERAKAAVEVEFAAELEVIRRTYPDVIVDLDHGSFGAPDQPEVRGYHLDYAEMVPLWIEVAKITGETPAHMPRSTAAARPMCEYAAGLPVNPVGHTEQMHFAGAAEIKAFAAVLLVNELKGA